MKIQKTNKCSVEVIMSFRDVLLTVFEVALVTFTIWAVFHEDRFIAFEDRIKAKLRRSRFRVIEGGAEAYSCEQI